VCIATVKLQQRQAAAELQLQCTHPDPGRVFVAASDASANTRFASHDDTALNRSRAIPTKFPFVRLGKGVGG